MEWDDLKYFLAVVRGGNVTAAARRLRVSVATVSRRMSLLERRLAARLFERKTGGAYTLTPAGEVARVKAEEIEQAIFSIERQVVGGDLKPAGRVSVATGDDIAAFVVAPRLVEFERRFPGISIDLVASFDVANLSRREADVALRTVRPAVGSLVIRHVGWWDLGLYAARTYADAHELRPGKIDLARAAIITWTEAYSHMNGAAWLAEHARGARIALAANSRIIQLAACKAGLGVAVLPCIAADRDPELIRLAPPDKVVSVKLWLVAHRDLARTARVRAVVNFLAAIGPRRM
jgi:DNA-binding transcriptional LysR family regulator